MKGAAEFEIAVFKLFEHWDILRDAVSSNFGGVHSKEKAEWLPGVVVDFFSRNRDLDPSEVESFVSEIMDEEFDLLVEDGSLKRLSKQLCRCFALARDERFHELNEFLANLKPLPAAQTPAKTVVQEDDEESDEDETTNNDEKGKEDQTEAMEIDEAGKIEENKKKPKSGPVVDEDGFTLVVGKKKH